MRTTVTMDADVEALLRKLMADRGLSFKEAINSALRAGLAPARDTSYRTATYRMGGSAVSLDNALQLAASLEDAELKHKLAAGR